MTRKLKPVPSFASEAEERTFWETHDSTDHVDWSKARPKKPSFFGTRTFPAYDLSELVRYIDWTPFFISWEMKGSYPKILKVKYLKLQRKLLNSRLKQLSIQRR